MTMKGEGKGESLGKILIPLISVIVGSLLTISGGLLQQSTSRRAETRELMREKMGDIYSLSDQIVLLSQGMMRDMTRMQIGQVDDKEKTADIDTPLAKLVMLVKLYEPELMNDAVTFTKSVDYLRSNASTFYLEIAESQAPLPIEKFGEMIKPMDDIQKAHKGFTEAIARANQKYK